MKRVIDESPLVEIYRSCHHNIERNLAISGLTQRHGPPDYTATYAVLGKYFETHNTNVFQAGRKSKYHIPDMINRGLHIIETGIESEEKEVTVEAEDIGVEMSMSE